MLASNEQRRKQTALLSNCLRFSGRGDGVCNVLSVGGLLEGLPSPSMSSGFEPHRGAAAAATFIAFFIGSMISMVL